MNTSLLERDHMRLISFCLKELRILHSKQKREEKKKTLDVSGYLPEIVYNRAVRIKKM